MQMISLLSRMEADGDMLTRSIAIETDGGASVKGMVGPG